MTWLQAFILGIIEGVTEFLPISSTGHMIITSHLLQMPPDEFHKAFEVIIQFGAILSVIFLFWKRFLTGPQFYLRLFTAFLPTALIGFLLKDIVNQWMESLSVVIWALISGGLLLYFSDTYFSKNEHSPKHHDQLSTKELLMIGLVQCLSLIPGVSRSGATILGGLSLGLTRKEAAEFSFFLAVPTMAAASGYKVLKVLPLIDASKLGLLAVGFATSFVVAALSIRVMMGIVQKYGFKPFGIYRILLGLTLLLIF